jgi:magnesium-transporting ATPase (P-type)
MRNDSQGDTPLDNTSDEIENDQEDSESSDVEIYLDSFDSSNSTGHMNVLTATSMLKIFFFSLILAAYTHQFWDRRASFFPQVFLFGFCGHRSTWTIVLVHLFLPLDVLQFHLHPFSRSPTWPVKLARWHPVQLTRIHICANFLHEA